MVNERPNNNYLMVSWKEVAVSIASIMSGVFIAVAAAYLHIDAKIRDVQMRQERIQERLEHLIRVQPMGERPK